MTKSLMNSKLFAFAMAMFLLMPGLISPVFAARADADAGLGGSAEDAAAALAENVPEEMPGPEVERLEGAYLYNFENDQVLFEYDSSEKVYPASTVKIMTAIVAFETFADALDTQITVTSAMLNEVAGNKIGFYEGEIVTVRQMLNCMLVNSANDAAIILAHACAGSTEAFVELMNDMANELGAYDT